jgi:hypothetical protein
MTDDLNFAEILDIKLEEIKPHQPLPVGTYHCFVDGQPITGQAGPNNTNCVTFNLKVIQAQDDVDPKQLAEAINGEALSGRSIKHLMFITDRSKHRIKKFLVDDLGVDPTNSLRQALLEAMGKPVLVKLVHQASKDGKTIFENVDRTARV